MRPMGPIWDPEFLGAYLQQKSTISYSEDTRKTLSYFCKKTKEKESSWNIANVLFITKVLPPRKMALPAGEISAGEKEYVSLLPPSSLPLSSKEKKL